MMRFTFLRGWVYCSAVWILAMGCRPDPVTKVEAPMDDESPAFTGAVAAIGDGNDRIVVRWYTATDNWTSIADITYLVFVSRTPGGHDFSCPTMVTEPGATSVTLRGIRSGYFVVRAMDEAGNVDQNRVEVGSIDIPGMFGVSRGLTPRQTAGCRGTKKGRRPPNGPRPVMVTK